MNARFNVEIPTQIKNIRNQYYDNLNLIKYAKHELNELLKNSGVGLGTINQINVLLRQIKECRKAATRLMNKHNELYLEYVKKYIKVSSIEISRRDFVDTLVDIRELLNHWNVKDYNWDEIRTLKIKYDNLNKKLSFSFADI